MIIYCENCNKKIKEEDDYCPNLSNGKNYCSEHCLFKEDKGDDTK